MPRKYLITEEDLAEFIVDGFKADLTIENSKVKGKIVRYGICSTSADSAVKTLTLSGFTLETGTEITVRFFTSNSASNPSLNINNTGAKAIRYHNRSIPSGYLTSDRIYRMVYDGICWQIIGDIDTNTVYTKFTGASSSKAGTTGLVPAPDTGKQNDFLKGDGSWVKAVVVVQGTKTTTNVKIPYQAGYSKALCEGWITAVSDFDPSYVYPSYRSILITGISNDMTEKELSADGAFSGTTGFKCFVNADGSIAISGGYSGEYRITWFN